VGIYWKGGYSVEEDWRKRVEELQAKVDATEKKSTEINTVIKTVYRNKIKIIKEDRIIIQDRIVKEAAEIDKNCKVSPKAIGILNDAAKPTKATVEVGTLGKDEK
jgi:ribosomal protein L7/L12